jgi:hypothetical protein
MSLAPCPNNSCSKAFFGAFTNKVLAPALISWSLFWYSSNATPCVKLPCWFYFPDIHDATTPFPKEPSYNGTKDKEVTKSS